MGFHLGLFGLYHLAINGALIFVGARYQRYTVRKGLDKKYDGLRIHSYWHSFFGDFHHKSGGVSQESGSRLLLVDVLVNTSLGCVIYTGYLEDYHVSGDKLERLILTEVKKSSFTMAKAQLEGVKLAPSEFSIEASTIVNIGLSIVKFSLKKKVQPKMIAKACPSATYFLNFFIAVSKSPPIALQSDFKK